MNPYIEKLNIYLTENPPDYGYNDAASLLEMLYRFYTEHNPIEDAAIKENFKKLDHCLYHLTIRENDEVFDLAVDLCQQFARSAFLAGIHVGVRLYSELRTES